MGAILPCPHPRKQALLNREGTSLEVDRSYVTMHSLSRTAEQLASMAASDDSKKCWMTKQVFMEYTEDEFRLQKKKNCETSMQRW